ncbi:MAG TPA: mannosyltransferase family protein [Chthoniobacterales bacterium]
MSRDERKSLIYIRRFTQSSFARDILVPFIASRAMLTAVGLLALLAFQGIPPGPHDWEIKPNGYIGPIGEHMSAWSYPLLNIWLRWDAGWYESVAKKGYQFIPGQQSNTAFFPLYPMTIRAVHFVFRGHLDRSWFLSGMLAANLQLLVALWLLIRLVRLDEDEATAARSALYYLAFATTLFFTAPFSESTFLLVAVAAFYYARRANWMLAGIFGALTALARSPGIVLCLPLAVEYLAQRNWQWRRIRADVLWLALIPAALGGLMFYFQARFGNLQVIRDSQAAWGNGWGTFRGPIAPLIDMLHRPMMGRDWVDLAFAWLTIAMAIYAAFTLRLSYGVYAVVTAIFLTSWGSYESMPRYILVVFPIFIAFAKWGRNERFDRAFLIVNSGLAALFMVEFALWRWVA